MQVIRYLERNKFYIYESKKNLQSQVFLYLTIWLFTFFFYLSVINDVIVA
jgi:polyferredoxin